MMFCRRTTEPAKKHLRKFTFQGREGFQVYSDVDWASCKRTAGSTSGGYTDPKGSGLELRRSRAICSSTGNLRRHGPFVDDQRSRHRDGWPSWLFQKQPLASPAARDDKLQHNCISRLWIQELAERLNLNTQSSKGKRSPADLLTKYLTSAEVDE